MKSFGDKNNGARKLNDDSILHSEKFVTKEKEIQCKKTLITTRIDKNRCEVIKAMITKQYKNESNYIYMHKKNDPTFSILILILSMSHWFCFFFISLTNLNKNKYDSDQPQ